MKEHEYIMSRTEYVQWCRDADESQPVIRRMALLQGSDAGATVIHIVTQDGKRVGTMTP